MQENTKVDERKSECLGIIYPFLKKTENQQLYALPKKAEKICNPEKRIKSSREQFYGKRPLPSMYLKNKVRYPRFES